MTTIRSKSPSAVSLLGLLGCALAPAAEASSRPVPLPDCQGCNASEFSPDTSGPAQPQPEATVSAPTPTLTGSPAAVGMAPALSPNVTIAGVSAPAALAPEPIAKAAPVALAQATPPTAESLVTPPANPMPVFTPKAADQATDVSSEPAATGAVQTGMDHTTQAEAIAITPPPAGLTRVPDLPTTHQPQLAVDGQVSEPPSLAADAAPLTTEIAPEAETVPEPMLADKPLLPSETPAAAAKALSTAAVPVETVQIAQVTIAEELPETTAAVPAEAVQIAQAPVIEESPETTAVAPVEAVQIAQTPVIEESPATPAAVLTEERPVAQAMVPVAQADTTASEELREDLQVDPLATTAEPSYSYPPSPNAGIPSGFGASWGDFFVSATAAGADRLRPEVDGSLSAGFGLGDPRNLVGLELNYNMLSIRDFGSNGSFDAKLHRELFTNDTTQASVAVGWNNFANYGTNVAGTESSVYGVVSAAHLLQPENPVNRMPITGTLGVGGGSFSGENSDVGILAGVGLQVDPQLSLNAAWSGVGLNLGASFVPIRNIPLTFNVLYGDVTNNSRAGSVAVFTIGYGYNFGPRFSR